MTGHSRGLNVFASVALVLMACIGLASCGGGGGGDSRPVTGSGGGETTAQTQLTIVPVSQSAGAPDLEVGSASASGDGPDTGANFTLSAAVSNTGDGAAPPTTISWYRSTDATITASDTAEGTDAVAALPVRVSRDVSILLTAPVTAGVYYYGACVDAVADESDTTDNCSPAVRVRVVEPGTQSQSSGRPNLEFKSSRVDHDEPDTGASFRLIVSLSNTGDGDAPATTIRWYRSTDATITTSDTAEGTDAVTALPVRASRSVPTSLTAPATAGVYYYGACVDAVADESDTTDNCSPAVRVEAKEPQPDSVSADPPAGRVVILPVDLTFDALGQSKDVSVQVLDENGEPVDSPELFLLALFSPCCDPYLANPPKSIAIEHTDTGLKITAEGRGSGSVTISAEGAASATLKVRVGQTPSTLTLSPDPVALSVGGTTVLTAAIADANDNAIHVEGNDGRGGHVVYWSSNADEVATVEGVTATQSRNTGRTATVTATGAGTATITATWSNSLRDSVTVTVSN